MRVSVFGLGYVGCVTAACLARAGHQVIGVDLNPDKVALLQHGQAPIVEPGLGELLSEARNAERLRATEASEEAVASSDVALICVGTPGRPNGQPSVDAIERVGQSIGRALRERARPYTVVLRSTVLPGTTEGVLVPALAATAGRRAARQIHVASNPEFLREGSALADFAAPPLTLVGCTDPDGLWALRSLYATVKAPMVETAIKTAETIKYVANAFHALKVCFANEIGDICASLGVDAQEVMRIFRMDRKLNISDTYLRPGFAFGGSCLPKDLRALMYAARTADVALPLLSAILPSNDAQIRRPVEAVLETRKRRIGVVGLAFKSGTDDLRESPIVALVETLIGKGCDLRILDRHVAIARLVGANRRFIEEEIPHISSLMCDDADELVAHGDVLVIGNAGEDATAVLARRRPEQIVIDLTRGTAVPAVIGTPA